MYYKTITQLNQMPPPPSPHVVLSVKTYILNTVYDERYDTEHEHKHENT